MMTVVSWFKNFDTTKAVIVAILSIVGSWYDLRGDVALLKQEANIRWEKQERKDAEQDNNDREIRQEIQGGINEIKEILRERNRNDKR